jgi:hypothetical protein
MRVFAGPNGSGKSSLKAVLPAGLEGIYLNPDDLERNARERGFVDLLEYGLAGDATLALAFLRDSEFLREAVSSGALSSISSEGSIVHLNGLVPDSYFASVLCDFLRNALLGAGRTSPSRR